MAARVRTRDVHGGILAAPAELLLEAVEPTALAGCMAANPVYVHRRLLPTERAALRNLSSEAGPKAVRVDGLRKLIGLFDFGDQALRDSLLAQRLGAKDLELPLLAALRKLAQHQLPKARITHGVAAGRMKSSCMRLEDLEFLGAITCHANWAANAAFRHLTSGR